VAFWLDGARIFDCSSHPTPAGSRTLIATGTGPSWAFLLEVTDEPPPWFAPPDVDILPELRTVLSRALETGLRRALDERKQPQEALTEALSTTAAAGQTLRTGPRGRLFAGGLAEVVAAIVNGPTAEVGWIGRPALRAQSHHGHWQLVSRPHTAANEAPHITAIAERLGGIATRAILGANATPSFTQLELEDARALALTSSHWPLPDGPAENDAPSLAAEWLRSARAAEQRHPVGVVALCPRRRP
jgi:hypothetical protein